MFDGILSGFKDLSSSIADFFGTDSKGLSTAFGLAGKAFSGAEDPYGSMRKANSLGEGLLHLGIENNFSAKTPEGANKSVSAEALEAAWLTRLNKFANIQSDTGVKLK